MTLGPVLGALSAENVRCRWPTRWEMGGNHPHPSGIYSPPSAPNPCRAESSLAPGVILTPGLPTSSPLSSLELSAHSVQITAPTAATVHSHPHQPGYRALLPMRIGVHRC